MKILVAAASRHGATQEIADSIGITLDAEGLAASVLPARATREFAAHLSRVAEA